MTYIIFMVICFALLMAVRIPIPFALLASTLVYYFGVGLPMDMVVVRLLRSFVILLDDRVIVLAGRRKEEILFDQIRRVFLISGHIAVDTGTIPRTAIPLIFANWRELYRVLLKQASNNVTPS